MGEAMPQASQSWSRPDDDDRDSLPADAAQVAAWLDWAVEEARLSEEVHVAAIAVLARAGAAKYYEDAVPFQETLLTSLKTRVASLKAREEPGMLQHAEKERLSDRLRGIGAACAKFGFAGPGESDAAAACRVHGSRSIPRSRPISRRSRLDLHGGWLLESPRAFLRALVAVIGGSEFALVQRGC